MKAWEIVGWARDGAVYCPECAVVEGLPREERYRDEEGWFPIFASDEGWEDDVCYVCEERLGD